MKRFSDFKKFRKINEQEISLGQDKQPTENTDGQDKQPTENTGSTSADVAEGVKSEPAKFFSKLFESREMAHVYHLQVKGEQGSYAAHKALNEYYDGILDFIDELIETYQGQYGIVEDYETNDTTDTKTKDKLEYFKELVTWTRQERKCIPSEDTHLHNIVDECIALMYKTIYKLTYNK